MQKKQNKIRPNLGFDFNHEGPEKSELSVQTLKSEKLPSFFSTNAAKGCPTKELAYTSFAAYIVHIRRDCCKYELLNL